MPRAGEHADRAAEALGHVARVLQRLPRHSRKWRCCGSMIAASRGEKPKNPASKHSMSSSDAARLDVVRDRKARRAIDARGQQLVVGEQRVPAPLGLAQVRQNSSTVARARGNGQPCRRWRFGRRSRIVRLVDELVPRFLVRNALLSRCARPALLRRPRTHRRPPREPGATGLGARLSADGGRRAVVASPPSRCAASARMVGKRNRSVIGELAVEACLAVAVHLHHQQRVAAEVEEVVVEPDLRAGRAPRARPRRSPLRARIAGASCAGRCRRAATRGAGSALRSILPFGVSGMARAARHCAGTMNSGRRSRERRRARLRASSPGAGPGTT